MFTTIASGINIAWGRVKRIASREAKEKGRMDLLERMIHEIRREVLPNSGHSMNDRLVKVETAIEYIRDETDKQSKTLGTIVDHLIPTRDDR